MLSRTWLWAYAPDSMEARIASRLSENAKKQGIRSLIEDGAPAERAEGAIERIIEHAVKYVALGPFEAVPDSTVKSEILRVARQVDQLREAIDSLSTTSLVRLHVSLAPKHLRPWGIGPLHNNNPDPISFGKHVEADGRSFTRNAIRIPANMSAKFDRFLDDARQLGPLIRQAAAFTSTPGRPRNGYVHGLFESAIREWAHAANQAPSARQIDGIVVSPLLSFLRDLIYPAADHEEVREALSDAVFLAVLRRMKRQRRGLLQRPVIPPRLRDGAPRG